MTHDRIEQMADAYAEQYEPRYRKAARQAYIDGLKHLEEFVNLVIKARDAKKKFNELSKGPSGGMAQFWREDAGFEMDRCERAVREFLEQMEA